MVPRGEPNHRHCDFQSHALPTELPGHPVCGPAAGHTPCHPPDQADSSASGAPSSSGSVGTAGTRYCSVSQRPDRHRRTVGCRTAECPPRQVCRRSGTRQRFASQSSPRSIIHRSAGKPGSDRTVKARPARCARAANASASACRVETIAGEARNTGKRCGATPTCIAIARKAARPAACGPASSSCSGGCTRGRTISANPSA